jgi:Mg/Co/Ni transporter MgtE
MAPRTRRARSPSRGRSPGRSAKTAQYVEQHRDVGDLLSEALQAAIDADASDPSGFISKYLAARATDSEDTDVSAYSSSSFLTIAKQRTGWLGFFMVGLLCCAATMKSFDSLLEGEVELAFFVPLLIGHGGNSGGQTVSTVIRALGSGRVKLGDAPRVVAKEAAAGVLQSALVVLALHPCLVHFLNISPRVSNVVAMTMPTIGLFANALGAALPFAITWAGKDPAVICGPMLTTSVDTLGLASYLTIATIYLGLGR